MDTHPSVVVKSSANALFPTQPRPWSSDANTHVELMAERGASNRLSASCCIRDKQNKDGDLPAGSRSTSGRSHRKPETKSYAASSALLYFKLNQRLALCGCRSLRRRCTVLLFSSIGSRMESVVRVEPSPSAICTPSHHKRHL